MINVEAHSCCALLRRANATTRTRIVHMASTENRQFLRVLTTRFFNSHSFPHSPPASIFSATVDQPIYTICLSWGGGGRRGAGDIVVAMEDAEEWTMEQDDVGDIIFVHRETQVHMMHSSDRSSTGHPTP